MWLAVSPKGRRTKERKQAGTKSKVVKGGDGREESKTRANRGRS